MLDPAANVLTCCLKGGLPGRGGWRTRPSWPELPFRSGTPGSWRKSETEPDIMFYHSPWVLSMEEGCACLLDASETLTSQKRDTSSSTHLGCMPVSSATLHSPALVCIPSWRDTTLQLGRRTEVKQGLPRSPNHYPLLHPFLFGSLQAVQQLRV